MLSRLDTIFVVAVLGIWVVIRARALRYLLVGDLVLALVVTFSSYLMRLGFDLHFFIRIMRCGWPRWRSACELSSSF